MVNKRKTIMWESYNFPFDTYNKSFSGEQSFDDEGQNEEYPVVVNSPFGVYRVDDSMNPFRRFSFWIGHTNFDIDLDTKEAIIEVPGVEVFVLLTRYRFIIAPGRNFTWRDVRVEIEKLICGMHVNSSAIAEIVNSDIRLLVENTYNELSEYPYWLIYVFPNGSVEKYYSETKTKEFTELYNLYSVSQTLSNGILLTSEEQNE